VPLDLHGLLRPKRGLAWRQIHWPREVPIEHALGLLRQLATDHAVARAVLEVEQRDGVVLHRLGVHEHVLHRVEQLVTGWFPDAALTEVQRVDIPSAWRIALSTAQRPLEFEAPERLTRALLAGLFAARGHERVVLQWVLGRAVAPRMVGRTETPEGWWQTFLTGRTELDPDRRQALTAKRGDHGFTAVGRVGIAARTPASTRGLAVGVLAALRTAEAPGIGVRLIKEEPTRFNEPSFPWFWPYTLNVIELLGLLAWPLGKDPLPGVPRDRSRWLRPDPRIRPSRRVLGTATAPGEERELGLSIEDARQHLHVIGPTGTGKSTLLANLIVQDIAAGRGIVVIDPKGDLVEDVLGRVPEQRHGDVVVLDPADESCPVGLNPLLSRGRSPELIADQVLAVFHGLWASNWGPRLQDILHSALLTLAGRGDASLCALPALLTNDAVRTRLRSQVDDPVALEPFWAWFDSISDAERNQAIAPVLNKLRPFLLRRSVRAIVGQLEPRFRIDEVFTKRKIVLVALRKGLIGPAAAALLGALLVAELWQAVLGRAAVPAERRHPVIVCADEFQDYVHLPTDMADALAQARGLGVGLVLAHQHLGQLPSSLRASVLANARSRVCFQLPADDAQIMSRYATGKLDPSDFQQLPRFEAYAQLVAGGEVTDFSSLRTTALPPKLSEPGVIRELSRRRYGRPAEQVEREIRGLVTGDLEEDEQVGRRRRRQP